jgi:hypothetical protein
MVEAVADDDAPLAVDQNAPGHIELPICTALDADGSHVAAVAVAQHLHSMICLCQLRRCGRDRRRTCSPRASSSRAAPQTRFLRGPWPSSAGCRARWSRRG